MGLSIVNPSGRGHIKFLSSNKGHMIEPSPYISIANVKFSLALTNYNMIASQIYFS